MLVYKWDLEKTSFDFGKSVFHLKEIYNQHVQIQYCIKTLYISPEMPQYHNVWSIKMN